MSVRKTPNSPPAEKFHHGMIGVVLFESFGGRARDPRKIARKKLPLFEELILDGLADIYRAWKRQKRSLKLRKWRTTSDSKWSKKLPDPRFDPDFDPKDPLGLIWISRIFKSVKEKKIESLIVR